MEREILLIVDDDPVMLQNLELIFQSQFDEVYTAAGPIDAEKILGTHTVTHLVCDYELGAGILPGTHLIAGWKHSFASIKRAVLFTATLLDSIEVPPEIDNIQSKRAPVEQLIKVVRG